MAANNHNYILSIRGLRRTGRNGRTSPSFLLCREHECCVTTVSTFGQDKRGGDTTDGKNNRENGGEKKVGPSFACIRHQLCRPSGCTYHYAGTRMPFSLHCVDFENKMVQLKRMNYEKEYIEKRSSLFWGVTQRRLVVLPVCAA
jgi:hypothetical protein